MIFLLLFCFFFSSCHSPDQVTEKTPESFEGRLEGIPIYQAEIPKSWKKILPEGKRYLSDTMLPIVTFEVEDVVVTVHNFPTKTIEERVSPFLQIQRWQKQFDYIEPFSLSIQEIAYGGFSGFSLEAEGIFKGKAKTLMAFAMQLAKEHYYTLSSQPAKEPKFRQMRADYTIKVLGKKESVARHRNEILAFAESFELIEEI